MKLPYTELIVEKIIKQIESVPVLEINAEFTTGGKVMKEEIIKRIKEMRWTT